MYTYLVAVVLTVLSLDLSLVKSDNFISMSTYNDCEGKDAGNYTYVESITGDCRIATSNIQYLIQYGADGTPSVMGTLNLAVFTLQIGAYVQSEWLHFITGGPLAGKFIYLKWIYLTPAYLKRCSSVLGYSYVSSKSAELLIADRLDMNVLISPTGGYVTFKKGCTTRCTGTRYFV